MLISHFPVGYIVTKVFNKVTKENIPFVKFGLLFSLWPDLDLFYFYFINRKLTFHHLYFTHLPFVLLICAVIAIPINMINFRQSLKSIYNFFVISWFAHLVLDTFTGGIAWLYPYNKKIFILINIPPSYSNWLLSFIFHWSFIIEICLVLLAGALAIKSNTKAKL